MQDKLTGRFTRIEVVDGKTYTCGCGVQPDSATCRTHGNAIAGAKPARPPRVTPNQRQLLEQLAESRTGEVTLPFRKAQVARALYRRGLVASYTSRNGFYVIQTQEAADRDTARRTRQADQMAMLPNANHPGAGCSCRACLDKFPNAAPREELQARALRIPNRERLTRLESELTGAAWSAYMAGRHAVNRDADLLKAAETQDPYMRSVYVKSARAWHHLYLKSARICRHLMGVTR